MKFLDIVCWILLIVGGLNWGLVGLADCNLVDVIFGMNSGITKVIYILVGLSAIYQIICCCAMKGSCCKK